MLVRYASLLIASAFAMHTFAQGETCATAVPVDVGTHTADGPATGGGATQGDATNADWFAFTPVVDAFLSVFSCGSQVDTRVFLHSGDCGGLTLVDSDDDGCPEGYPPGSSFLANVPVAPGNTYYIEWDDRYSTAGFDWQLQLHGCPIAMPTITPGEGTLTVEWENLANGAPFTLEYGPAGFVPGSGDTLTGIQDGNPVELSGLEGNTEYDIYITVDCGGGNVAPFSGPWHGIPDGTEPIVNDYCENAILLTCGSAVDGSTIGAEEDPATDCGTAITAPGVWYTFVGDGQVAILSTCADHDFDTKINVYTGDCDDLQCVTGNDDGPFGCNYGSEVVMPTVVGTVYRVLVQGYNGAAGTFTITLQCSSCGPPLNLFVTPADVQAFFYWSSFNPGANYVVEYGPVGFLPGNGTEISGVVGADGPPVTIPGLTADTEYDVYVYEACVNGEVGYLRGPVGFTTLADPLAVNAFCEGALPITCGQDVEGNTAQSIYTPGPACGSAYTETPGLWYSLVGDGNDVILSTCGQATFDTKISVYTGACNDLVCVVGNDDAFGCDGNTSRVTFHGEAGVTYVAIVHGYDGETGPFTLSMSCAPPCAPAEPNDDCASAVELFPQPFGACAPTSGSNACAYASAWPNPACDPFSVAADVWYALQTQEYADHVLTVTPGTIGEFGVALYEACDPASFVECYDPAGPIALNGLSLNTTYYIRIWNSGGAEGGTFTICDEADVPFGLEEALAAGGLQLSPVPARSNLLVAGLANGARTLRILDMQGRLVHSDALNGASTQRVDVSALPPGSYVLHVEGERKQVARLVVG